MIKKMFPLNMFESREVKGKPKKKKKKMQLLSHSTLLSISAQFGELERWARMDLIFFVFFMSREPLPSISDPSFKIEYDC